MIKLNVPYYSQHQDVAEPSWRPRSCGIVCAKMVLKYLRPKNEESIDDLIEEGVIIGGYTDHGWDHETITRLFRNRGIHSYKEEFRSVLVESSKREFLDSAFQNLMITDGINKIHKSLENKKPVLVSVETGFDENKESHLIVLTGFAEDEIGLEGFFYNDPNAKVGVKKDKFTELGKFRKFWRKMAIFVD